MNARITLKFDLMAGRNVPEPQLRTPVGQRTCRERPALHDDGARARPSVCARQAVRHMIDHLVRERGLSREEAYIPCSVAVDLKVSEIVDAPNWIISAFLPETIFGGGQS